MSMMPLTAALIIPTRVLWEQTHACIQNLPVRIAVEQNEHEPSDPDALLDRIERHRVDVVLVDAGRVPMPLEEFVQRLKETSAQPAVFVLHTEASPQLILEALRAGANEFLHLPLSESLRAAFETLSASRSKGGAGSAHALGKVFGFISARGGCGASTFALHVAHDVARSIKQPSLLADFDFEAGLLRFLMRSKSAYSVREAIDNLHRIDASLWKGLITTHANQMDFIPAPEDLAARRPPVPEETTHLMRFIRSTYPAAVVDFGRSISLPALDALPELETLYIITTTEQGTLSHARRAISMVEERGFAGHRIKVLVNRVAQKNPPELSRIEQQLGRPPAGAFVSDFMAFYDAYSEGHLLQPGTRIRKELTALSDSISARILGDREAEKKTAPAPAGGENGGRRWFSFLQRSAGPKAEAQRA
jgi:pilus assembly protein CpaE